MAYQIQADSNEINVKNIQEWLTTFKLKIQPHRVELGEYYDGKNQIIKQGAVAGRPNYTVNINMAKYIIDVATSYTFGIPITYTTKDELTQTSLDKLQLINKLCSINDIDFEQGGDLSTYGVSYQMILVKDGEGSIENRIVIKHLKPEQTFFVIDNTILGEPICAVYFYDYVESNQAKTKIYCYDEKELYIFDGTGNTFKLESKTPHNMGGIPIIECINNDDAFSDIEVITPILDSLSLSVSNTTDDLQSIANALLNVQGAILNEGGIEEVNDTHVLNSPAGAKVEWVIKNINPDATQKHLDNLLKFLFQIAQVPDLTDDAFGGNQSGVAMQYKLWGMDQLWVTKTSKYEKAIYKRLKILLHLLQYEIDNAQLLNDIEITFSKNIPQDNTQVYEMVKALKGVISDRSLLQNIPFIEDVDAELEELDKQAEKDADRYGFNNNSDLNNKDNVNE